MLLHFIFMVKKEELELRKDEFVYIEKMAKFFKFWIKKEFEIDMDVKSDMMITNSRSFLRRLDTHTIIEDHRGRGEDIFHFYLTHFRPIWTDCTCEGYHAENFGMVVWSRKKEFDEKHMINNSSIVSHELAHELLRQKKHGKYVEDVHDVWTRHLFGGLEYIGYDEKFNITQENPMFLTLDTKEINTLW